MFKDIVDLLVIKKISDGAGGFEATVDTRRSVFADRQSVKGAEFYQAAQADMKVEVLFVLYLLDYQDEKYLFHNQKYFKVIRTYEKGDFIELSCERRTGSLNEVL